MKAEQRTPEMTKAAMTVNEREEGLKEVRRKEREEVGRKGEEVEPERTLVLLSLCRKIER